MPRVARDIQRNNFTPGFISDVSLANSVPGATVQEDNFTLFVDGSRRKREGLERGGRAWNVSTETPFGPGVEGKAVDYGYWRNAGQFETEEFLVVKFDQYVRFFRIEPDFDGDYSESLITGPTIDYEFKSGANLDLSSFSTIGTDEVDVVETVRSLREKGFSLASVNGDLIITAEYIRPIRVSLTGSIGDTSQANSPFTVYPITPMIRDLVGVNENSPADYNPTTLTVDHEYNLKNQGWTNEQVDDYFTDQSVYPSNAELPALGWYVDGTNPGDRSWSASRVVNVNYSSTPAPRGKIFLDPRDPQFTWGTGETVTTITGVSKLSGPNIQFSTDSDHDVSSGSSTLVQFKDLVVRYQLTSGENHYLFFNGEFFLEGSTITVVNSTTFEVNLDPLIGTQFFDRIDPSNEIDGGSVNSIEIEEPGAIEVDITSRDLGGFGLTSNSYSVCSEFSGRLFLAGLPGPPQKTRIFYSQIVSSPDHMNKFYQEADPTSEEVSELVDTDGGYIEIPGLGKPLKMVQVQTSLVIFASNGIWIVSGGDGYFTPTNYVVRKLMSIQMESPGSIIEVEGAILFWAEQSIYILTEDKISGYLTPQDLTMGKLAAYMSTVNVQSLPYVIAGYNTFNKTVYWTFADRPGQNKSIHNVVLCYDMRLEAFYKYRVGVGAGYWIAAPMTSPYARERNRRVHFLTFFQDGSTVNYTFSTMSSIEFTDWRLFDYDAYLEFQYDFGNDQSGSDLIRKKQASYIFTFCQTTERDWVFRPTQQSYVLTGASSLLVQGQWSWSASSNSGKWTTPQEAYRLARPVISPVENEEDEGEYNPDFNVITSKLKLRGRGNVLKVRYVSPPGYDADLLAYGVPMTISAAP